MSAVKFEIKSRFTGSVLFGLEADSLRLCVEAAVKARAYLRGASLRGADLGDADLRGADLSGADLGSVDGQKLTLVGDRPYLTLGPMGSRHDMLQVWLTDAGVYVRAGCFWDTLEAFRAAVEREHGQGVHGHEYRAAIALIECHAQHWTPAQSASEAA